MGYGEVKKRLFDLYKETLAEPRKRHAELEKHPEGGRAGC